MTYVLFGIGILFILIGFVDVFPKVKQTYLDMEELQKWQKQKSEIIQAREDLTFLLEEIQNVSSQVITSIEHKINDARTIEIKPESKLKDVNKAKSINLGNKNQNSKIKSLENKKDKKQNNTENKLIKEKIMINQETVIEANKEKSPDKHSYIYQLAKDGLTVDEIAQKVQMGKGEIELIIGIKRRGEQA